MVKLYETGRGWIYDTSEPMSVYLLTDTPRRLRATAFFIIGVLVPWLIRMGRGI